MISSPPMPGKRVEFQTLGVVIRRKRDGRCFGSFRRGDKRWFRWFRANRYPSAASADLDLAMWKISPDHVQICNVVLVESDFRFDIQFQPVAVCCP